MSPPDPAGGQARRSHRQGRIYRRASFDNKRNLKIWNGFHDRLCCGLKEELLKRASPSAKRVSGKTTIDVAVYCHDGSRNLERTLDSLAAQTHQPRQVLIAVDALDDEAACENARVAVQARGLKHRVLPTLDFDAGYALNEAARYSDADYVCFLQDGWTLKPEGLSTLAGVARHHGAEVLSWYHERRPADGADGDPSVLVAEMIGGPSETIYLDNPREIPLFVRRTSFEQLKGFTVDYRVPLHGREFISKAIVSGTSCETVPVNLGSIIERDAAWLAKECYDADSGEFRLLRPFLAAVPLAMRETVLVANGLQRRIRKGPKKKPQTTLKKPKLHPAFEGANPPESLLSLVDEITKAGTRKSAKKKELRAQKENEGFDEQKVEFKEFSFTDNNSTSSKFKYESANSESHKNIQLTLETDNNFLDDASIRTDSENIQEFRVIKRNISDLNDVLKSGKFRVGDVLVGLNGEISAGRSWQFPRARSSHEAPAEMSGWPVDEFLPSVHDSSKLSKALHRQLQLFSGWAGPDPTDGRRYAGRVLDIVDGAVVGWIADREELESAVSVVVYVNGRRLGTHLANLQLPSVYRLSDHASKHGFHINLFDSLISRSMLFRRPARVDVKTSDGIVLAQGLQAYRPSAHVKRQPFDGHLDTATSAGTLRGWAWLSGEPARHLEVSIYFDGQFYTRVIADEFRGDLAQHGIGSGDHAFTLQIPERFRSNGNHQVNVFIADTGIPLHGSPLLINAQTQSRVSA